MSQAISSEHRYLQIARTLRKEIVDGVYPVGSQLPTEHQLCERFAVSRYTIREALRRLREDNLVASRPRAGTRVVPRPASSSYAQDAMSIDDLLAFAAGAQLNIEFNEMVTIDDDLAARTGLEVGSQWLSVRGYRQPDGAALPLCRTEYYINRTFVAPGNRRGPAFPRTGRRPGRRGGHRRPADAAHLQDLRRRGGSGDDQHPSVRSLPLRDHHAPRERSGRLR
jgi:DNA-binding GntR family transcriptional regulator